MKKSELSRKTKKDLLLHIENMHLRIENDHLESQRANREMQDILARHKEGTPENKLDLIRAAAGKLRYDLFNLDLSPSDRKRVIDIADRFLDKL
jgi:hypothetical protein